MTTCRGWSLNSGDRGAGAATGTSDDGQRTRWWIRCRAGKKKKKGREKKPLTDPYTPHHENVPTVPETNQAALGNAGPLMENHHILLEKKFEGGEGQRAAMWVETLPSPELLADSGSLTP